MQATSNLWVIFLISWFIGATSNQVLAQTSNEETSKAEPTFQRQDSIVYKKIDDDGDQTYPAVLVVHGGQWRNGNRKQLRKYATALAELGFACFAIDYRLAPEHKFPAQIEDCRSAVTWIRQNSDDYKVDSTRIGAIGYSAGGHLVSLLGTTGESPTEENGNVDTRLNAVVAGGAPTDFRWMPDNGEWARYWMGGNLDEVPDQFKLASVPVFIDKHDPPFFFFHGESDSVVPLALPFACHLALKRAGVESSFHKITDKRHIQAAFDITALEKACEFLQQELQTEADQPAIEKAEQ